MIPPRLSLTIHSRSQRARFSGVKPSIKSVNGAKTVEKRKGISLKENNIFNVVWNLLIGLWIQVALWFYWKKSFSLIHPCVSACCYLISTQWWISCNYWILWLNAGCLIACNSWEITMNMIDTTILQLSEKRFYCCLSMLLKMPPKLCQVISLTDQTISDLIRFSYGN